MSKYVYSNTRKIFFLTTFVVIIIIILGWPTDYLSREILTTVHLNMIFSGSTEQMISVVKSVITGPETAKVRVIKYIVCISQCRNFTLYIECAVQSRNSQNGHHSIEWWNLRCNLEIPKTDCARCGLPSLTYFSLLAR